MADMLSEWLILPLKVIFCFRGFQNSNLYGTWRIGIGTFSIQFSTKGLQSSVADRIRMHRIHMFWASWIRIRLSEVRIRLGSFYRQAKIVRITLIPTVLWLLYDFLSSKNDVNVPSKSNKQKSFEQILFSGALKVNDENTGTLSDCILCL